MAERAATAIIRSMARLLFVDDDPQIRSVFRRIAERHGFTVMTEADGEAGLDAAVTQHPDLVVLDVNMPRMDGRDVCRALKSHDDTKDITVVFLSGHGDEFNRHVCLELGAEDFIEKPFDLDGLMRKVKYLLRKSSAP